MFIYHAVHTCLPPVQQLSYTWYAVLLVCAFAFTHCTKCILYVMLVFSRLPIEQWAYWRVITHCHLVMKQPIGYLKNVCTSRYETTAFSINEYKLVFFFNDTQNPSSRMMRVYNSFICNLRFKRGLFNVIIFSFFLSISISIFYDIYEY